VNPGGEDYLARIPVRSHRALARIRAFHLQVTQEVLRRLERDHKRAADAVVSFDCR
jgi:hypothetical protein